MGACLECCVVPVLLYFNCVRMYTGLEVSVIINFLKNVKKKKLMTET